MNPTLPKDIIYGELYGRNETLRFNIGDLRRSPELTEIEYTDVDVSKTIRFAGLPSSTIRTFSNGFDGVRIADFSNYNGSYIVNIPEVGNILLKDFTFMLDLKIDQGLITDKCFIIYSAVRGIQLVSESSERYRSALKIGGNNPGIAITYDIMSQVKPGMTCIDNMGRISMYLGNYFAMDMAQRSSGNFPVHSTPSPFFFILSSETGEVEVLSNILNRLTHFLPEEIKIPEEEAFLIAFYKSRRYLPYTTEPELTLERRTMDSEHMLWNSSLGRFTYPSIKEIRTLYHNSKVYFDVVTNNRNEQVRNGDITEVMVYKSGGLRRIV